MSNNHFTHAPNTAFLEILYGCNLNCRYCYVGADKNHAKPVAASVDALTTMIRRLRDAGVEEIVLLGGEPLLHPSLERICAAIKQCEYPSRGVVSNGTSITTDIANILSNNEFWIDISFRAGEQKTFDDLAGDPGTFDRVVSGLQLLAQLKVPVGIEYDATLANYTQLFDAVRLVHDLGVKVKQVQIHRILPEGDASTRMSEFFLSIEQWREVFDQCLDIEKTFDVRVVFEDGFPFCLLAERFWHMITPCACGHSLITIGPKGDARYCSCDAKSYGNILTDDIQSIWRTNMAEVRGVEMEHAECQKCTLVEICRGGCSASGKMTNGRFMDIFSDHFKARTSAPPPELHTPYIFGQSVRTLT